VTGERGRVEKVGFPGFVVVFMGNGGVGSAHVPGEVVEGT
jgi:hypothetical protein